MSGFIPNPNPNAVSYRYTKKIEEKPADTISKNVLNRLDRLEHHPWEQINDQAPTGHARWMLPYADLLTLLFGLFIALFGLTKNDSSLWHDYATKLEKTVQIAQVENQQLKETNVAKMSAQQQEAELATQITQQLASDKTLASAMTIHPEANGLVISITDHILFAPGQAALSPSAKQKLDTIARTISTLDRPIRIEGHTDNSPIQTSVYPSNWELSTARATHIIQHLVQSHRFLPSQLSAAGYGEFHPIANNSSEEGKQKNRRVDIVLLAPPIAQVN